MLLAVVVAALVRVGEQKQKEVLCHDDDGNALKIHTSLKWHYMYEQSIEQTVLGKEGLLLGGTNT